MQSGHEISLTGFWIHPKAVIHYIILAKRNSTQLWDFYFKIKYISRLEFMDLELKQEKYHC